MTPIDVRSNPAMPGLVTIKIIDDAAERLEFSDGVPQPFEVEFSADFRDPVKIAQEFNHFFKPHQPNPGRAFFKIPTAAAIAKLEEMKEQDEHLQRQEALQNRLAPYVPPKTLDEMIADARGQERGEPRFKKPKFLNDEFAGWALAIVFLFALMWIGAGSGGGGRDHNEGMYENSRQIRR